MKFVILLSAIAILIGGFKVQAEPLAALGTSMTFETATDGHTIQTHTPFSVRGGYRFDFLDTFFEYSQFRASEGNRAVFVSREHEEWLLWGRHVFRSDWIISPFAAAGIGLEQETVETDFGPEVSKDTGEVDTLAALAFGVRGIVVRKLELGLEMRASFSATHQPNPILGFGATAGWIF
jgi:hypothetical protein